MGEAVKSIPITLDKDRAVRLSMNALITAEAKVMDITGRGDGIIGLMLSDTCPLTVVIALLWAGLLHEEPDLAFNKVAEMVSLDEISSVKTVLNLAMVKHLVREKPADPLQEKPVVVN